MLDVLYKEEDYLCLVDWQKSTELKQDSFFAFNGTGESSTTIPFIYQDIYVNDKLYKLAVSDDLSFNDLPSLMSEFQTVSTEPLKDIINNLKSRLNKKHQWLGINFSFKNK